MSILNVPVFLLSGSPRMGKTTLAKEIAKIVRGTSVSFGDHVRFVAASTFDGSTLSRKDLQDLGQQLVKSDPRGFCAAVLGDAAENASSPLVVDGLRHLSLLPIIREMLPGRDTVLMFVESSPEVRKSRWDGHLSEDEVVDVDSHPVESDLNRLRRRADLVIDTSEGLEVALRQFTDWLGGKYPNLFKVASVATGNR
jgi:adenylate kinase family enzyme